MKKNMRYIITVTISFFLVSVSAASIIPAKKVFENNEEKIGEQLKEIVLEDAVENKINLIFGNIEDTNKKINHLHSLSNLLENTDGDECDMFNNFANKLYSTYKEEFDSFSQGSSDSFDLPKDEFESDNIEFENIFDFTLIKPKSKERRINVLINEISERMPFLQKMLEIFTKESVETQTECLSLNDNSLSLYHKGNKNAIITGPIYKINSFLLLLEASIIYKQSGISSLNDYCNKLNTESDIKSDADLANNFKTITTDLNLESRIESLQGLSNEEKKAELNQIITDIQNHPIYTETTDIVNQKFIDNNLNPQTSGVINLVIGLVLMYAGFIIFVIGVAAAVTIPPLGLVYMSVGVILMVAGYSIAFEQS